MNVFDGILLASGGLDSTVLAYELERRKKNIILLFIKYGQHCHEIELSSLKKLAPKRFLDNIVVINIGDIYKESNSRMIKEADLWNDKIKQL